MSSTPFRPKRNVYPEAPKYIQIETTIKCNAKCWFCPQHNTLRQPNYMEDAVWKKIIDDTRNLGVTYRPFLLNEPFADKRMCDIVSYIKEDTTARVEFNTNGSMLIPRVTDRLLELGVDVMRFSIDGLYKETFDESRGISYDKVYEHVSYFLKRARETGSSVQTEVRMIKLPNTEEEQKAFKEYWEKHEPGNILFTDLYSYPWENQTHSIHRPCLKIADQMFFYVDGKATLCCWDSHNRQIVGDITKEGALDIWNGEEMSRCRGFLDKGEREKLLLCSRCDAYENVDFSDWEGFEPKDDPQGKVIRMEAI